MFDLGWSEMAIVMLVALIVIGPKDLPRVARSIGKWTGKARAMARDFQRALDDMAREAELDEVKKTVETISSPTSFKNKVSSALEDSFGLEDAEEGGDRPPAKAGGQASEPDKTAPTNPDATKSRSTKSNEGAAAGKSADGTPAMDG